MQLEAKVHGRRSYVSCAAVDLLTIDQVGLTLISLMRKWTSEHGYNIKNLFKLTKYFIGYCIGNYYLFCKEKNSKVER